MLTEFFFATSNDHKLEEAKIALGQHGIEVERLEGLGKVEIQHTNLEEIAETALALILPKIGEKFAFVEDSGLFVHQLNGFPGPYSSFTFETLGVEGILKLLKDTQSRKAEFRSSVAFGSAGKILSVFSSVTEGIITTEAKGESGFGFDPIFVPIWTNKTFAQMMPKEKDVYSHRAKALKKLALWFLDASKTGKLEKEAATDQPSANTSRK